LGKIYTLHWGGDTNTLPQTYYNPENDDNESITSLVKQLQALLIQLTPFLASTMLLANYFQHFRPAQQDRIFQDASSLVIKLDPLL
jgi:hypothetical protein